MSLYGAKRWAVEFQIAHADFVEGQRLCGHMLHGVDVDLVFQGIKGAGNLAGAGLDDVGPARQHGLVAHPQHFHFELVGHFNGIGGIADHITTAHVNFGGERHGERLAGNAHIKIAIVSNDAFDDSGVWPRAEP